MLASTAGWTGFFAVEILANNALSPVNQLAGRLVSGIAGYAVASTVGATLVGGVLAGAVTGIAMSAILQERDTGGAGMIHAVRPVRWFSFVVLTTSIVSVYCWLALLAGHMYGLAGVPRGPSGIFAYGSRLIPPGKAPARSQTFLSQGENPCRPST